MKSAWDRGRRRRRTEMGIQPFGGRKHPECGERGFGVPVSKGSSPLGGENTPNVVREGLGCPCRGRRAHGPR